MARTLTMYERSTPTYLFNITDYASSGVDLVGMKIMMCLDITDASPTPVIYHRYIVDSLDNDFDYASGEVWADSTYCRNLGSGMFAVTVPLWRYGGSVASIEYQVFLYGNEQTSGASTSSGGDLISTGRILHHNILIDSGTIEIEDSLFPLTTAAKASVLAHDTGLVTMQKLSTAYKIDDKYYIVDGNTGTTLGGLSIDYVTANTLLEICRKVDPTITTTDQIKALTIDEAEALFKAEIEGYAKFVNADMAPIVI